VPPTIANRWKALLYHAFQLFLRLFDGFVVGHFLRVSVGFSVLSTTISATKGKSSTVGTITSRRRQDGMRYTAQIRLKHAGKVIHSESETFTRRALAAEWLRRREAELDKLRAKGVLEGARYTLHAT
jgi:hypothetical protein